MYNTANLIWFHFIVHLLCCQLRNVCVSVHLSPFPCFVLQFRVSWYAQSQAQWHRHSSHSGHRLSGAGEEFRPPAEPWQGLVYRPCGTQTCNCITNGDLCVVCIHSYEFLMHNSHCQVPCFLVVCAGAEFRRPAELWQGFVPVFPFSRSGPRLS